ncbi:MAG: hypothetical protein IPJ99_01115 [Betaproteobacteria bacterium]|nr:hypothetical protein [Betaproteobacteria bacterium]
MDSPDATGLPVKLAVALLKNGRGEIDINLPISGSLEDPQFSLGGIIVRVIVNLFVKAVTSPFTLIASLFGGGEELSMIDFDPGRTALGAPPSSAWKLWPRPGRPPGLNLEITGRADPETERDGMKRRPDRAVGGEKLREQARRRRGRIGRGRRRETRRNTPTSCAGYKEANSPNRATSSACRRICWWKRWRSSSSPIWLPPTRTCAIWPSAGAKWSGLAGGTGQDSHGAGLPPASQGWRRRQGQPASRWIFPCAEYA